jgi:hypothetical protein
MKTFILLLTTFLIIATVATAEPTDYDFDDENCGTPTETFKGV